MKRAVLSIIVATLLSACSSFTEPNGERLKADMGIDVTPILFATGEVPEVSYSAEVILGRAEGFYQERQFEDAALEYGRFIDLHATHPWAPYALFRQGMCYVHQVKSSDRDAGLTLRARQVFENLLANYPDSPAVAAATEQRDAILNRLAEGELEVARFYIRTHRPDAALARLDYLMTTYPDTPTAQNAWYDKGRALALKGDTEGAVAAYTRFLDSSPAARDDKRRKRVEKALNKLTTP